jgi:hypothetical protein
MSGLGRDFEPRLEQPQIVTFPGPEHHAMLAQSYRFRIPIGSDMPYVEEAHA